MELNRLSYAFILIGIFTLVSLITAINETQKSHAQTSSWIDDKQTLASSPSLVSDENGRGIHIFGKSVDGSLMYAESNDTLVPSMWSNLGGIISSDPASVYDGTGKLFVFARGSDNLTLWYITLDNSTLGTWRSLGGELESSPAAVSTKQGIFVFTKGLSDELWYKKLSRNNWTEWKYLGGQFESEPYAINYQNDSIMVFVQGKDRNLWTISYDGISWGNWTNNMLSLPSSPTVVNTKEQILIFAKGTDDSAWFTELEGGSISSWESVGGVITHRPMPLLLNDNKIILYSVGTDGRLFHKELRLFERD